MFHFIFILFYRYVPTRLWGFSGHVQTVLHSIIGRVKCPWPLGERIYISLADGSTLTYDLYQPLNEHEGNVINNLNSFLVFLSKQKFFLKMILRLLYAQGLEILQKQFTFEHLYTIHSVMDIDVPF